ncbi:MAG: hypothetical protein AAFQ89_06875 [Cyanobacteria bacterium J06626_18]
MTSCKLQRWASFGILSTLLTVSFSTTHSAVASAVSTRQLMPDSTADAGVPSRTTTAVELADTTPADSASPTAPTVTSSTLDNGWVLYSVPEDGFAIALPPEWVQIDVDPDTIGNLVELNNELNPNADFISGDLLRTLATQGIKLYGLDVSPASLNAGLPTGVNVLKLDVGLVFPLDTLLEISLVQVAAMAVPETPITDRQLTIANMDAAEIKYTTQLPGVAGELLDVAITQYLVPVESSMYVITLSAPATLSQDYDNTFTEIGSSFQLLN